MKWHVEIVDINNNIATLILKDNNEIIKLPLDLLPGSVRKGDIFDLSIYFNPFETLNRINS